jgi:hypothetical protein
MFWVEVADISYKERAAAALVSADSGALSGELGIASCVFAADVMRAWEGEERVN